MHNIKYKLNKAKYVDIRYKRSPKNKMSVIIKIRLKRGGVGINIGNSVRTLRTERNLTQNQLAKISNFSPSYISDIENNNKLPTLSSLMGIADSLEVPLLSLLSDGCCCELVEDYSINQNISDKCKNCKVYKVFKEN